VPKLGVRPVVRAILELADLAGGLILIAITALNLVAVFMRYVMLDSISWSEEIMRYGSIWLTFLGAAAASYHAEHLSLDLMRFRGTPLVRRLHESTLHLLASVFAAVVLWQGVRYCIKNWMQTAPTTGVVMLWAYGAIAVGGALMLIAELAKTWDTFSARNDGIEHRDAAL
jgi:TRAP-type C4-dicarboxylate transport system permease small subunit